MLRRFITIASAGLFVLTCALAVASCLWKGQHGIVRVTETVIANSTTFDPSAGIANDAIIGRAFEGVVIDHAAIVVGRWGWFMMEVNLSMGENRYRNLHMPLPLELKRITKWRTDTPFQIDDGNPWRFSSDSGHLYYTEYAWNIPLWPLALIFGVLPAIRLRQWYRRRRARLADRSICQVCGYDLRASPGRCPECGAISGVVIASPGGPPEP